MTTSIQMSAAQEAAWRRLNPHRPVLLLLALQGWDDPALMPPRQTAGHRGRTLHRLRICYPLIGDAAPDWSWAVIQQYPDPPTALEQARSALAQPGLERILVLTPAPLGVRLMLRGYRALWRALPAPRRDASAAAHVGSDPRNPSPAAMDWLQMQSGGPLDMLNLLKFRDQASPSTGAAGTGAAAYHRYGHVAMRTVFGLGGDLPLVARYRLTLASADGDPASAAWDELALMRHACASAFLHMTQNRRYLDALAHRDAGLARTVVLATQSETTP